MDYICLGLSTLDYFWSVPQRTTFGEKILADNFFIRGGGMAATAAFTIAKLEGEVAFWGRAGDDASGALMHAELKKAGVNVEHFKLFPSGRSPVASVIVEPGGERQISTFRGSDLPKSACWLPLKKVRDAKVILADMRWLDGAEALFSEARRLGIPTVLDADIADEADYQRILPLSDHVLFSSAGLTACAPGDSRIEALKKVKELGCRIVGVTNGSKGTTWMNDQGTHFTPAFKIDAVDTTGAGDVFHGAYTLAIGNHNDTATAMHFASGAAALKCAKPGGRDGIPTIEELTQLLEKSNDYD